jgi:anti-sigma B factor antagonist
MRTALLIYLLATQWAFSRNTPLVSRLTEIGGTYVAFAPLTFDLQLAPKDGAVVATLVGELDLPASEAAFDRIDLAARKAGSLVLDLSGLTFMDSSGLRLVLRLDVAAREGAFELSIVPGPANVQQVFELVGLADALPFVSE